MEDEEILEYLHYTDSAAYLVTSHRLIVLDGLRIYGFPLQEIKIKWNNNQIEVIYTNKTILFDGKDEFVTKIIQNQLKVIKRSEKSNQEQPDSEEEEGSIFSKGIKHLSFLYMWYYPLSPLRVGYTRAENEISDRVELKERRLRTRLILFFLFTFIQTFLLALVFTWPLTLSPLIDALADLVPTALWQIIESVAKTLQDWLSPFDSIIRFIQDLSKIFNTFNPSFAFVAGWWLASQIRKEVSDDEDYEKVNWDADLGTNGLLQEFGKKTFGISSSLSPWFVLILMQFFTFLFLLRRARSLVYELQSDKECEEREKQIRNALLEDMKARTDFVRTGNRWGREKKWYFIPEYIVAVSEILVFSIPLFMIVLGYLSLID